MSKPLLIILMGSKSDLEHCETIKKSAEGFGIETVMRIGSAHKTPEHALEILKEYEENPRPKVYITVAGRSNALSGFVDGFVSSPVIACPPVSSSFGGADIYSSLRMPSAVSPAVVLEPKNAALLAARIFALADEAIMQKIKIFKQEQADKIISDDSALKN